MPTTTEYVIQKRGLQVWQYVTWYSDRQQAEENFKKLKAGNGYSYRLVELQVLAEYINEPSGQASFKDVEPGITIEATPRPQATGGWTKPSEQTNGWGGFKSDDEIAPTDKRGLHFVGTVWVCNRAIGFKKRVPEAEAARLLQEPGYFRGGPRTNMEG